MNERFLIETTKIAESNSTVNKNKKIFFQEKEYPEVQLSIFIDQPTPFITEALELVGGLDYPKSKINLFIYVDVSSTFIAHY